MDAKTAQALEESIKHWDELTRAEYFLDVTIGCSTCALCGVFRWRSEACSGCPVEERTGKFGCQETPYDTAHSAWIVWQDCYGEERDQTEARAAFHRAATDERDFLISLRESAP